MTRQTAIMFGKQTVTSLSCRRQACSGKSMKLAYHFAHSFPQTVTTVRPRIWTASRPSSPLSAARMAQRSMRKSSRRTGEVSCHGEAGWHFCFCFRGNVSIVYCGQVLFFEANVKRRVACRSACKPRLQHNNTRQEHGSFFCL